MTKIDNYIKAIIFIVYHPGSFPYFNRLRQNYEKKYKIFLFVAKHPYITEDVKTIYYPKFHNVFEFPDIYYDINIFKGFYVVNRFKKRLTHIINTELTGIDKYILFTDGSAYLPVNIMLSFLIKNSRYLKMYRLFPYNYSHKNKISIIPTIINYLYTFVFSLNSVYTYRLNLNAPYGILYKKDLISVPVFIKTNEEPSVNEEYINIESNLSSLKLNLSVRQKSNEMKNIVLFFGDYNLYYQYNENMPDEITYNNVLNLFFEQLQIKYADCKIIYKGHPSDKMKVMPGVLNKRIIIFSELITSEMLIDKYSSKIRACYTVTSTSLRYSSLNSIPSYFILDLIAPKLRGVFSTLSNPHEMGANPKFIHYINRSEDIGEHDSDISHNK